MDAQGRRLSGTREEDPRSQTPEKLGAGAGARMDAPFSFLPDGETKAVGSFMQNKPTENKPSPAVGELGRV